MSKEKANEQINVKVTNAATKGSSNRIVMIVVIAVVAILVGVILFLLLGKDAKSTNQVITPDNVEEAIAELDDADYTPVGSYEVTMNTDWVFPDGSSASSNAYVENCVNNRNTVYFTIALDSDDSSDIYTSPYLEVGSHIENIKFDNPLDAGSYDAVLTYHLVDSNSEEISTVAVSITITVEN